jgi:hypothetical protein
MYAEHSVHSEQARNAEAAPFCEHGRQKISVYERKAAQFELTSCQPQTDYTAHSQHHTTLVPGVCPTQFGQTEALGLQTRYTAQMCLWLQPWPCTPIVTHYPRIINIPSTIRHYYHAPTIIPCTTTIIRLRTSLIILYCKSCGRAEESVSAKSEKWKIKKR